MGPRLNDPVFGSHKNTIVAYFQPLIKTMALGAETQEQTFKKTGKSNADAIKPKKPKKKAKVAADIEISDDDSCPQAIGGTSGNSSSSGSGSGSALPPPPLQAPPPFLLQKDLGAFDTLNAPWSPAKWRVVTERTRWGEPPEYQSFVEVKSKITDSGFSRLCPVAVSVIPVYQIIYYNKRYNMRSPRFILRCLLPSTSEAMAAGGISFLSVCWGRDSYRHNETFRANNTFVVVLEGHTYEGLHGFTEDDMPLKDLIEEMMRGDNDVMIRHNLTHGKWYARSLNQCLKAKKENLHLDICAESVDILISSFVAPETRDVCGALAPVMDMDHVEDFLRAWQRIENAETHCKRWNLEKGEVMVRQIDETLFDVNDNSDEEEICKIMWGLFRIAYDPPRTFTPEQKEERKAIQLNGTLADNMIRAVFRVTNYVPLGTCLLRIRNEHYLKVLRIEPPSELPSNSSNSSATSSSTLPVTQAPPPRAPLVKGTPVTFRPLNQKDDINMSAATVETEVIAPSPPAKSAKTTGSWLVGGPGHTAEQMAEYEENKKMIKEREERNRQYNLRAAAAASTQEAAANHLLSLFQPTVVEVVGGNHTSTEMPADVSTQQQILRNITNTPTQSGGPTLVPVQREDGTLGVHAVFDYMDFRNDRRPQRLSSNRQGMIEDDGN